MRKLVLLALLFSGKGLAQSCTFQLEADYLAWFSKKNPLPVPLVTSASFDDDIPGAIGQPHTRVLRGKEDIGMGWMQGFEVRGKSWIHQKAGFEAAYFLLPKVHEKKTTKTSGQVGSRNLAVPIFDVTGVFGLNGVPGETIFILPGPIFGSPFFSGVFNIDLSSQFQGAELSGLYALKSQPRYAFEWIWGLRWFQLEESLKFRVSTVRVPNSSDPFNASQFIDRFHTTNNFVGGQMGLKGQYKWGRWQLEGVVKGALGASIEELKIHGSSKTITGTVWFLTSGTAGETLPGGIFAQPSNIGTHHKTLFAYAVETRLNNSIEITKNWSIDIGYTFLWISKVLRPGNQIDRKINSTRTALADASRATTGTGTGPVSFGTPASAPAPEGKSAPKVHFKQSSFWEQGLNVGIRLNF
ncbi:MAG: BBP7 family outer membrane beta-barrel protein [Verrucomicrobia bacterium]|nr:BBP7 family outer membrane beta-barrel protein [Verrucomicrobiota bacterium]